MANKTKKKYGAHCIVNIVIAGEIREGLKKFNFSENILSPIRGGKVEPPPAKKITFFRQNVNNTL